MIQRAVIAFLATIFIGWCAGCDPETPNKPAATSPASRITVGSLSPAATDLIVGMGLADRLVAVSNFEPPRKETDALPRVGDYRSVDWEKLSQLRPSIVITQYRADKMPEGFEQRCGAMGIRLFNRKIDSLDDSFTTITELGALLNAAAAATDAQEQWRRQMDALAESIAGKPKPRTLLIVGETGLTAVGPGTFLDDLLRAAGGQNVLADGNDYVTLDREKLANLDPEVVMQLIPSASPQQLEQAAAFWKLMQQMRAVSTGRIHVVTDADVLLPGFNCPKTAMRFAELLHAASKKPSARGGV